VVTLISYRITRDGARRLLVLLHGWSAEQHHLAAYVPLVDPDERFSAVCPRAPHPVEGTDGASWYDRTDSGPVASSFLDSVATVDRVVADECDAAGIDTTQCVIGGFSQGGFLALALAGRSGAPRFAGVWAMCCGLPSVDGLPLDLGAASGTPALIQVGERDQIIPPDRGRAAAASLRDAGWTVSEHGYDMAHSQRIEMLVDARDWLAGVAV
jgi:phospholipase/carboxylesterase